MERSISDNKNNLITERSSLLDESLMGLSRIKEQAHKHTRAENVSTLIEGIIKEMKVVHSNYINRKNEEEAERLLSKARKKRARKKKNNDGKQFIKQRNPKVILRNEKNIWKKLRKTLKNNF